MENNERQKASKHCPTVAVTSDHKGKWDEHWIDKDNIFILS
jgi:hypothetical protein